MLSRWAAVRILTFAASVAATSALAGEVEVRLRALSAQAIAGIPVVVELSVANPASSDVEAYELTDPFVARIFWTWRTASGRSNEVRLRDYHFSVVPEPAFPRKVTVPAHGQVSRLHTVPTPTDFPDGEVWTLAVRIRDPIDQSIATAELSYEGHVLAEPPVMGKIAAGLAEAALLEYSRDDVLANGLDAKSLEAVREASEQNDPVAKLIVVSKRMRTGEDPVREWEALDRALPEVRLVRNYLLLDELRRSAVRRRPISAGCLRLVKRLRAEDPLHRDVRDTLRSARRGQ